MTFQCGEPSRLQAPGHVVQKNACSFDILNRTLHPYYAFLLQASMDDCSSAGICVRLGSKSAYVIVRLMRLQEYPPN